MDRSWRNPNLLVWHGRLQLIDHGATLTFHHSWASTASPPARPYDASAHALRGSRPDVAAADEDLGPRVTEALVRAAVDEVPEVWLHDEPRFADVAAVRAAYVERVLARHAARASWVPPLVAAVAAPGSAA